MPYRKSYRRRRAPKRVGKYQGYANLALKAFKMAVALKGIINSEKHVHDVALTSAISSTGTVTSISGVAQSDDISGRTGRSVLAKSIQLKTTIASHASATGSRVRTIIFVDNMNQGSTPSVTDILADDGNPESMRNVLTEQGRFRVLYDQIHRLDNVSNKQATIDKYIKLNHHIFYEGTAAANVGKGSIWLLRVSNEATNTVSQNTETRMRFYDN